MRILLTGATGFVGSHTAELLLEQGHELLLARRTNSDLWRCTAFEDKVTWIDTDMAGWMATAVVFAPEAIVNCAWDGVGVDGRADWSRQVGNIVYQQQLLDIALQCRCTRFVGLGSQAEYGTFYGIVSEDGAYPHPSPNSAYGATKLAAQTVLRAFCDMNDMKWYWFRLFSSFGEREADCWLIPSAIKNMLTKESMDLTGCEQKYSYLYVKDVADIIARGCVTDAPDGIYNISSTHPRPLREILETIRDIVNPEFVLNFGAIPYRTGQSMHNQGDMTKTYGAFGLIDESKFEDRLMQTVDYYRSK